ncbi:Aste57867_6952 [Aphanomyces stellatus]|uniref:Aste57867_6952 protein n=1 Tax=Aphanomyces stellatus TaxID=120398 RepID=A0A485KHZ0_9STRA|nr:hypothetical protein As57867_006930 [Aphanomyces stellatus]VFT83904.1 Aste57867_6952 [Aphanomyces stellatus]
MADKLAEELHMANVSVHQLQELKWSTKERVLLQLLEKNPSSKPVWEKVKQLSDDRRQVRAVEKAEQQPKDVLRKSEDSYRADFMKLIEVELARIGAPSMLSWQRLVMEKDCNYQAMRIFLTKIKSSQKKRSTTLPLIELKAAQQQQPTTPHMGLSPSPRTPSVASSPSPPSSREPSPLGKQRRKQQVGSSAAAASVQPLRRSITTENRPAWNNELVPPPPEATAAATMGRASFSERKRLPRMPQDQSQAPPLRPNNNQAEVEPTPTNSSKSTDPKLKQALLENAALKRQVEDLQALHVAMDPRVPVTERRVRLVEAQNIQLQRQVTMLTEAVHLRQHSVEDLHFVIRSLEAIVEKGEAAAKDAGAEQGKADVAWMMAVPTSLLAELHQIDARLRHVTRKCSMEAPLRNKNDDDSMWS